MLNAYIARGRRRQFARLAASMPIRPALRILDVGGTWDYWQAMPWRETLPTAEITLFNTEPQAVPEHFTAAVGDARDLSRYPDRSFDVVFSHSVIGHVGTFADQARMASELRRVGRCVILQTPNQYFPIDWRTLVPCFHFLPVRAQAWCFRHLPVGRYAKAPNATVAQDWASRIRNLTARELRELFPDGQIVRERIAGLTKSLCVIRHDP